MTVQRIVRPKKMTMPAAGRMIMLRIQMIIQKMTSPK